ncbi:MAG TPA: SDR family oxidoreductase [Candidatus Elarobacter sp.]|nr:SDR family oxidoreductase [Candidatus Elarobacter sp.]
MAVDQFTMRNPREMYPKPDFQAEQQPHPGSTDAMRPRPDHGEATYRGSGRLVGRNAIVTGGDSGIGRAVALAFAREGANVLVSYLSEDDDARETVRLVEEAQRKGLAVKGDLRDEQVCTGLVQRAVAEFGRLDILVVNAAFQNETGGIEEITTEQFDRTLKTNLYAMFWLCKAAVAVMPSGSTIINTASVQASKPSPSLLDYATTKGGIFTFTQALAQEVIGRGIRVNCVAPGPVWTPLIPATMKPDEVKEFGKQSPMERPTQPAELAPAYVFLASGESSYITGARIPVTGGTPVP